MARCQHFDKCEFVLQYVAKVSPHWDDFVSLYCDGDFQDICKRLDWFKNHRGKPSADLMPTGRRVPEIIDENSNGPA